ncbi:MAG: hypothetical protein R3B68_12045 [Phycisphaerales bacterium]
MKSAVLHRFGTFAQTCAATALFASTALAQPRFTIQELAPLSGNTGSAASLGLNDMGDAVGRSTAPTLTAAAAGQRPVMWLRSNTFASPQPRDLLPNMAGFGTANDRNNVGTSVGTFRGANATAPLGFVVGGPSAVAPAAVFIQPLPGGTTTAANAVNDSNWVVGSSNLAFTGAVAPATHAILWRQGQTQDLGTLGGRNSEARDVSTDGSIVGVSDLPPSTANARTIRRAFIVPGPTYPMVGLSALGPSLSNAANAISDTAIIVGSSETLSTAISPIGPRPTRAVLWTPASLSIINLGTLRNSDASSEALGVNDAGWVVGWSGTPSNALAPSTSPNLSPTARHGTRAFLWIEGTMHDLTGLIPPNSGWVLHAASDVNEQGQIVGWGSRVSTSVAAASQVRAFLLTPVPLDADSRTP